MTNSYETDDELRVNEREVGGLEGWIYAGFGGWVSVTFSLVWVGSSGSVGIVIRT